MISFKSEKENKRELHVIDYKNMNKKSLKSSPNTPKPNQNMTLADQASKISKDSFVDGLSFAVNVLND